MKAHKRLNIFLWLGDFQVQAVHGDDEVLKALFLLDQMFCRQKTPDYGAIRTAA